MNTEDKEAQCAVDLGSVFLEYCMLNDIDENTAQAALGNAWFRLCIGMRIHPKNFTEMLNEMGNEYLKRWKQKC